MRRKNLLAPLYIEGRVQPGTTPPLNSTLIKEKFGTYGVDVLVQEPHLRIASLYSLVEDQRVTRSLAIVDYIDQEAPQVTTIHHRITAGGSIGQSFVDEGFEVVKKTEALVELPANEDFSSLYKMMRLLQPAALAFHTYLLNVRKNDDWIVYARVTEVHSPEHLGIKQLVERFGDSAYFRQEHPRSADAMRHFRGFISQHVEPVRL